jgi:hypothetical protein
MGKPQQAGGRPCPPVADGEAATRVATSIKDLPPDWLGHVIKIVTLPIYAERSRARQPTQGEKNCMVTSLT